MASILSRDNSHKTWISSHWRWILMVIVIILGLGLFGVLLNYFHKRYKRRQQKVRAPPGPVEVSLWIPVLGPDLRHVRSPRDLLYCGTILRPSPEQIKAEKKIEKNMKKEKTQVIVGEEEVGVAGPSNSTTAMPACAASSSKKLEKGAPNKGDNMV